MRKQASLFRILTVLGLSAMFSSCIFEDRTCCYLSVGFTYTYNVKGADAFLSEVKDLELYVFDSEGVFVERFKENGGDGFYKGYRMILPSLGAGRYTFVALGRNRPVITEEGEFLFSALEVGKSVLQDLMITLNTNNGISNLEFASIYDGVMQCELKNGTQYVDIPMNKLTNRLRVVLMPYSGTDKLKEYDFAVKSGAVHLDYEGNMSSNVPTCFQPHHNFRTDASPSVSEGEVGEAVIADFQLSRLILEDKPTLVISDSDNGEDIVKVNLAWLLSLQGIAEHRREWSDQEYLDRQDAYSITFFIDNGLFVKTRIIVNGWVISIEDVSLG